MLLFFREAVSTWSTAYTSSTEWRTMQFAKLRTRHKLWPLLWSEFWKRIHKNPTMLESELAPTSVHW